MKRLFVFAFCALIGLSNSQAADRENRRIRIINNSSKPIYHFYASNIDRTNWEEDILGTKVLLPGQQTTINIDDGSGHCLYDFKAVLSDQRSATTRSVNVCTQSSWTVVD
jgi:hypothetical protein